jgi:alanine dehydrogenase
LEQALVFSPNSENREKFANQMGALTGMNVTAVDSAEQVARAADILLTATNSNVPTFDGEWLKEGTHVTSLVSSNKGLHEGGFIRKARREVDDRTLQRADIVMCNSVDQEILDRTAVVWQTCEDGVISWDKVTDMGRIMAGEVPGRTSGEQITFFKQNAFWGVGDQAIGRAIYEKALEKKIGMALDISGFESQTDSSLEG